MTERWGDSQADRDALDNWLTADRPEGDDTPSEDVVIYQNDGWAAVYVDGQLVHDADDAEIDDWLRAHYRVITVWSPHFWRPDTEGCAGGPCQTLEEVYKLEREADERAGLIAELERQSRELADQARQLRELG